MPEYSEQQLSLLNTTTTGNISFDELNGDYIKIIIYDTDDNYLGSFQSNYTDAGYLKLSPDDTGESGTELDYRDMVVRDEESDPESLPLELRDGEVAKEARHITIINRASSLVLNKLEKISLFMIGITIIQLNPHLKVLNFLIIFP